MESDSVQVDFKPYLSRLERCRKFLGQASDFWPLLAEAFNAFPECLAARIVLKSNSGWKVLGAHPKGRGASHVLTQEDFNLMAKEADVEPYAERRLPDPNPGYLILTKLNTEQEGPQIFGEFLLGEAPLCERATTEAMIQLAKELPRNYERALREKRLKSQLDDFSRAVEVLASVNARREFTPASMALVNELADRFGATRVSLGWVDNFYVKVCAMSGTDRIERKVEVVQRLEAAMEECRDQEEEILYPSEGLGGDLVTRSHEAYLQESHVGALISVPLRVGGEVCAIVSLEREKGVFNLKEALSLRVIADQVAPVLFDLKKNSRWFGKRWADSAKELFAKAVGPRHTWLKVGAITFSLFFIFFFFVPYTYRVKASFQIVPDRLALLPVPFAGFIDEVYHQPGDAVTQGTTLFAMDDGEIRVEKATALADLRRYRAEAERAQAEGAMGDYRVSLELAGQAEARLELAEYRLARAEIRAPFDGVLVEGDLRDRLGAPVQQGEAMMKFSRLDGLYVEVELEERDIDLLDGSNLGQVAFASRPDLKFSIEIDRIEPSAQVGQGSNFFVIQASLVEEEADWLRPGMTGVAKLDGGRRTLAWRATHRLVDFLRMFFWI